MVPTSQACSFFYLHCGSHLLSIGMLMAGIKVRTFVSCSCDRSAGEMPHTKTNENRIKAELVHIICWLILWSLIHSASRPVENKLCNGPIPNRSQLCQISCPIDCEVSPWGAWGPCTFENCDDQAGKKGTKTEIDNSDLCSVHLHFCFSRVHFLFWLF